MGDTPKPPAPLAPTDERVFKRRIAFLRAALQQAATFVEHLGNRLCDPVAPIAARDFRAVADAVIDEPTDKPSLPTPEDRAMAEAQWRRLYMERMIARGVHQDDAQMACDAAEVDLSEDPAEQADAEMEYWNAD